MYLTKMEDEVVDVEGSRKRVFGVEKEVEEDVAVRELVAEMEEVAAEVEEKVDEKEVVAGKENTEDVKEEVIGDEEQVG